jgi:hypothetical protein
MLDFLPAEAARVAGDMEAEDRAASLALLDNSTVSSESGGIVSTNRKWDTLQGHVSEVMKGWRVRERPFASSVPLFGPLVVGLRERINNLSTRWYVQPILQQQVEYNASVARALREMSRQIEELQARVGVQSILVAGMEGKQANASSSEALAAEIDSLRVRLEQLELEAGRAEERDAFR